MGHQIHASLESLDPEGKQWRFLAPMPSPRMDCAAVYACDSVFVRFLHRGTRAKGLDSLLRDIAKIPGICYLAGASASVNRSLNLLYSSGRHYGLRHASKGLGFYAFRSREGKTERS